MQVHHQGCSIALLLAALREKDVSAEMTAKHLYSALGHRPHEDEAAQNPLSPATVSLVSSLPKITASAQLEELVSFISKGSSAFFFFFFFLFLPLFC